MVFLGTMKFVLQDQALMEPYWFCLSWLWALFLISFLLFSLMTDVSLNMEYENTVAPNPGYLAFLMSVFCR